MILYLLTLAGSSICTQCSWGLSSIPGSTSCSLANTSFQISITFPLTEVQFTPSLQSEFLACIATAAGVIQADVVIIGMTQYVVDSSTLSLRRDLGRLIDVQTKIDTIGAWLQDAVIGVSNKDNLDDLFENVGLPASLKLGIVAFCTPGQYSAMNQSELSEGFPTVCKDCSAGMFSTVTGQVSTCQQCANGKYTNVTRATSCTALEISKVASAKTAIGIIVGYALGGAVLLTVTTIVCLICARSRNEPTTQCCCKSVADDQMPGILMSISAIDVLLLQNLIVSNFM